MPNHVKQIVLNLLKDYERLIKNALELKDEQRKKTIKEAEETNFLIINLISE